jgi:hypothetical protein
MKFDSAMVTMVTAKCIMLKSIKRCRMISYENARRRGCSSRTFSPFSLKTLSHSLTSPAISTKSRVLPSSSRLQLLTISSNVFPLNMEGTGATTGAEVVEAEVSSPRGEGLAGFPIKLKGPAADGRGAAEATAGGAPKENLGAAMN